MNKEKYHELLNDATVSRFSDFGYSNEAEVIEHFHKTKNYLRNRPLKVPSEQIKNKYDIGMNKFPPNQLPQNNIFNNNLNNQNAFNMNNNMFNNNMNNNSNEKNNIEKNEMIIDNNFSLNMTNFKFNNYESERKFVLETRF